MKHLIGKTRRRALRAGGTLLPVGRGQVDAVRRVLRGSSVQAKLTVNAPGDAFEQEADRLADRVVSAPSPRLGPAVGSSAGMPVQRMCDECERELGTPTIGGEEVRRQPVEEEEDEKEVQTKRREGAGSASVSPGLAARIASLRDGGRPIPAGPRAFFETRFGADFSDVRLHHDSDAAETARALRARAYTVGRDVVFGPGEYAPENHEGRRLMAHELTHVLQQRRGRGVQARGDGPPLRRWAIGGAPAPDPGWVTVPANHRARVDAAEDIVRGLLSSRRCRNFFRDSCTNGQGANALRNAFNNARVYHMPVDDNTFGEQLGTSNNIAYNQRAFRIGRFFLASTLLHEMFHTCDPTFDARDEIDAETAVETCRLYAPFILRLSASSGAVGDRVTIRGVGFGGAQGPADRVQIGGVDAPVHSWGFAGASAVEIEAEVPAGAVTGHVVVINNNVRSNAVAFTVT